MENLDWPVNASAETSIANKRAPADIAVWELWASASLTDREKAGTIERKDLKASRSNNGVVAMSVRSRLVRHYQKMYNYRPGAHSL